MKKDKIVTSKIFDVFIQNMKIYADYKYLVLRILLLRN